ncbi:MAG: ABC transporter substrate-binding protein/permease [Pirellulaceae bacterium]|jgi:His/Glu/Gln/Arg/opine family amino acid ABC transporter permease subunit|nr:ABC transporter substrate-binding protein/permease [Thermoguttaceae bacterium]MDI9443607.1 ABC transporter substrate-binding protein/permease [Planctomycetota bacterium]NLZ03357.1 ABC transporter substrate-binding protein/permease [Pirellulaceae bacterium]
MPSLPAAVRIVCLLGIILAGLCPAAPAIAQNSDSPLRVALTGKYPPFSYYNNQGNLAGFDVDVARQIAERLGRRIELVATEWDGILAGLLAEKYEAIIGSMAITPERAKRVSFSEPYYQSGAQLFIHRDNPAKVYSIAECDGRQVSVVLGETYQRYLEQNYPGIQVVTLKSSVEIFDLLEQKRVTGFVSDRLIGSWQIKTADRPFVPVGDLLYAEKMAIPVRKEDSQLLADINRALQQMRRDGTMQAIHNKYFGLSGPVVGGSSGGMSTGVVVAKLGKGFAVTLGIAGAALAIGFLLAIPCGLVLNHPRGGMALIYWPVRTVVDFLRGTPVLIQLLFAWMGLGLSPYIAAIGTLAANSMAYMAEVVRAGLISVDYGQVLAGRALALNRWQVFRHIVWPQAFRVAIPPLMNSVVALTKDTALVAVISVAEVIREAQAIISVTFEPRKYYFIVAVMFFVVTFPLMKLAALMERRIRQKGFAHD